MGSHFGIETIRMKSSVGLAGRAFSRQKIYYETDMANTKYLSSEERDLNKLKIHELKSVLSIPVLER